VTKRVTGRLRLLSTRNGPDTRSRWRTGYVRRYPGAHRHLREAGGAGRAPREVAQTQKMQAADIAETITFIVTRPRHMSVNEILVRPTEQDN